MQPSQDCTKHKPLRFRGLHKEMSALQRFLSVAFKYMGKKVIILLNVSFFPHSQTPVTVINMKQWMMGYDVDIVSGKQVSIEFSKEWN